MNKTAELLQSKPYCDILAMIPKGAAHGRYSSDLCSILGMTKRELCKHIEQLRRSGVVIIGDVRGGYYRPENLFELESYIQQEEHRAKSIFYTLKSARELKKRWSDNAPNEEN